MQTRDFHDDILLYGDKSGFSSAYVNGAAVLLAEQITRLQVHILLFTGYIILGQSLNPSELQFPNL